MKLCSVNDIIVLIVCTEICLYFYNDVYRNRHIDEIAIIMFMFLNVINHCTLCSRNIP